MQQLNQGATLQNGKYRIEKVLGQGGFGITYLATQTVLGNKIAIKELFMQGVNDRQDSSVTVSNNANSNLFTHQKRKFVKEAQRIAGLNNKHIVKVHDMFEENDTAYYVMDYIDGVSLQEVITHHHGALAESSVRDYLNQILSALSAMHQHSIWHLDIKPANIMLDKNGNIVLIDFGASKQIESDGTLTVSTSLSLTQGFAAPEQLQGTIQNIGAWTDFYALGATLYVLLTRTMPPTFADIASEGSNTFHFSQNVSTQMRQMVEWMMKLNKHERPQSVDEIQRRLSSETKVAPQPVKVARKNHSQNNNKSRVWVFIAIAVFFVILAAAISNNSNSTSSPDYQENSNPSVSSLEQSAKAEKPTYEQLVAKVKVSAKKTDKGILVIAANTSDYTIEDICVTVDAGNSITEKGNIKSVAAHGKTQALIRPQTEFELISGKDNNSCHVHMDVLSCSALGYINNDGEGLKNNLSSFLFVRNIWDTYHPKFELVNYSKYNFQNVIVSISYTQEQPNYFGGPSNVEQKTIEHTFAGVPANGSVQYELPNPSNYEFKDFQLQIESYSCNELGI
uniref:serine/threonine protein kinase n=1 Tax=Prevotella sp. TaxID=59823 RepID=UPI004026A002